MTERLHFATCWNILAALVRGSQVGRPVKLSDRLADAAAEVSVVADRSLAAQIEHWANLGRSVELALTGHAVHIIKSSAADATAFSSEEARKADVLGGLRRALSPEGQSAALGRIAARGPRYGTDPDDPTMIIRLSPDGRKVRGRVIDGDFIPERFLPKKPASQGRKKAAQR